MRERLRRFPFEKLVVPGLVLFGLALRLRQYLAWRSLWLDEAMLALNIVGRNFGNLLKPLDYEQGAPVGFLLLEKLVISLTRNNELTLRLVPLLAGCAALLLFPLLLRQGLTKTGGWTALTLFALGAPLVYYASEVKQYSLDVFVTLLLLWLGGRLIFREADEDSKPTKDMLWLTIAGMLSVWFSHPAIFALAGVSGALFLHYAFQKDIGRLKIFAAMIAAWGASFVLLYFVSLRGLAADSYLLNYWSDAFMPFPPWTHWDWFASTLQAALENPVGLDTPALGLAVVLLLAGLLSLLRRNWRFAALPVLTLLAALAASALGKYPFAGRMILFAAPLLMLLIGAGVEAVASLTTRLSGTRWLGRAVALLLATVLFYQPLSVASQNFLQPKYYEHITPAMSYLQTNHKPGDVVYVYYWAVPAFRYYAPFYKFSEGDFMAGNDYEANHAGLLAEIDQYKSQKRVWILFSHVYEEKGGYNEKDALLAHLNEIGVKRREFIAPGTSVYLYLYDLSAHQTNRTRMGADEAEVHRSIKNRRASVQSV